MTYFNGSGADTFSYLDVRIIDHGFNADAREYTFEGLVAAPTGHRPAYGAHVDVARRALPHLVVQLEYIEGSAARTPRVRTTSQPVQSVVIYRYHPDPGAMFTRQVRL